MKIFQPRRIGQLLYTTGAAKGRGGILRFTLLLATGSIFTILPWENLATIGIEPMTRVGETRIVTASGVIIAPVFKVEWFSCFGLLFNSFPVVAHTLPEHMSRFGILGMDFLRQAMAHIDVFNAQVQVEQ